MKYVVHCSNYAGTSGDEYLTPTQRAQKHIRRLKELLAAARADLEQKDSEILRLTKEVVELRLFKASLSSPEECSKSSDCNSVPTGELAQVFLFIVLRLKIFFQCARTQPTICTHQQVRLHHQ